MPGRQRQKDEPEARRHRSCVAIQKVTQKAKRTRDNVSRVYRQQNTRPIKRCRNSLSFSLIYPNGVLYNSGVATKEADASYQPVLVNVVLLETFNLSRYIFWVFIKALPKKTITKRYCFLNEVFNLQVKSFILDATVQKHGSKLS